MLCLEVRFCSKDKKANEKGLKQRNDEMLVSEKSLATIKGGLERGCWLKGIEGLN